MPGIKADFNFRCSCGPLMCCKASISVSAILERRIQDPSTAMRYA